MKGTLGPSSKLGRCAAEFGILLSRDLGTILAFSSKYPQQDLISLFSPESIITIKTFSSSSLPAQPSIHLDQDSPHSLEQILQQRHTVAVLSHPMDSRQSGRLLFAGAAQTTAVSQSS
jgi:hypothetical protein